MAEAAAEILTRKSRAKAAHIFVMVFIPVSIENVSWTYYFTLYFENTFFTIFYSVWSRYYFNVSYTSRLMMLQMDNFSTECNFSAHLVNGTISAFVSFPFRSFRPNPFTEGSYSRSGEWNSCKLFSRVWQWWPQTMTTTNHDDQRHKPWRPKTQTMTTKDITW